MSAIISLTTIPPRIGHIRPALESLLGQGLPVHLWLPRYVGRLRCGFDAVPDWIAELGVRAELVDDCASATKLLPALSLADTVLTADDDHTYGEGWAAGLLAWAEELPAAAIAYRGRIFRDLLDYNKSKLVIRPKKPRKVDLITGVHGALYRAAFFDASIFDEWREWPRGDDIVISAHLWRRGIPMYVVPRGACAVIATDADLINPLYKANTGKKKLNDIGIEKMYRGRKWRAV